MNMREFTISFLAGYSVGFCLSLIAMVLLYRHISASRAMVESTKATQRSDRRDPSVDENGVKWKGIVFGHDAPPTTPPAPARRTRIEGL